MRYSAFISYSYRDRKWASWVHRAIEGYRIPRRLQGREGRFGVIGPRLPPVFRDRDELAASADLGEAVMEALRETDTLIVICSPRGAASRWVNEEIRAFTALGRRDRIRCIVVDGQMHSDDPAQLCMPPALFENGGAEPLAADIRKHQDGKSAARLKLIASILDVPYDELRQRDAQRRQRRLMLLAAASTLGLLAMTALAVFAFLSRNEAVRQRDLARQRTITAERTVTFVKSMFELSDPTEARGTTITAREILDRGVQRITTNELANEPAVKAELAVTLGEVYGSLGLYKESDHLLRWTFGIPHHEAGISARQLVALGDSRRNLGDYESAVKLYRRAIALAHAQGARSDLLPRMLVGLAEAQSALGETGPAEAAAQEALRLNMAALGPADPEVARDLEALANNAFNAGNYAAARPYAERALAIRLKTEGPDSPSVSDNVMMLGDLAHAQGDGIAAERYYRSRLAIDERVLGPAHPDVATMLNNIGRILIERRAYREAEPLLARAVAINMRQRGEMHDDMAFVLSNLALARAGLGQRSAAEALFEQALLPARKYRHRALGPILADLAALRCEAGHTAAGDALIAEARPIVAQVYPDDPWRSAWVDNVAGACLLREGKRSAAMKLLMSSTPVIVKRWGADSHFGYTARQREAAAAVARPG